TRKLLTLLNHVLRKIYGIDALNTFDERPCYKAGAAANIEHVTRLRGNEIGQNIESLGRIGRTVTIGINDAAIFEPLAILRSQILWFFNHLSCISPFLND